MITLHEMSQRYAVEKEKMRCSGKKNFLKTWGIRGKETGQSDLGEN